MAYIKYDLGNDMELWVEVDEPAGGVVKASIGDAATQAQQKFEDALEGVKRSAVLMRTKLEDLRADEVQVNFGLKATGDLGVFAVAKVGAEANYGITLKWSNRNSLARRRTRSPRQLVSRTP
jgi:hypothetical protein